MTYLVDSVWLIDGIHGIDTVKDRIAAHWPEGVAISVISLGELYDGAISALEPKPRMRASLRFVNS